VDPAWYLHYFTHFPLNLHYKGRTWSGGGKKEEKNKAEKMEIKNKKKK
jgi:hypothetical protein